MEEPDLASRPPSWASHATKRLAALALTARNVSRDPNHMAHRLLSPFASYLFELAKVLKEMQREAELEEVPLQNSSTRKMDAELKAAEQLIDDYFNRCNLYLLMCCPELLTQLKRCYASLKAIMESFSQDESWSDFLSPRLAKLNQLQDEGCSLKLGPKEEMLHDSLEQGMLDSIIVDSSLAVNLARHIAECLGLSLESEGFAAEIAKLKEEKAQAERRKGKAHALYLEQFIVLLDKSKAATTNPANREDQATVQLSPATRDTLILPLQSFICTITKDVMRDPVQIASGQTYERAAIERWFREGHTRCPTGVELPNDRMKSNFALRQAIAEWKERNSSIRLENASEMIRSDEKEQQLKALQDLQELCEEDSLNKYKVASQNLMPGLVHLAESSDLELRKKAFTTLELLAKDNKENQEIMVSAKVIGVTVRCLARQYDEAPECVLLMRTLSGNPAIAAKISRSQSAVLFLVTLIQDQNCGENVKAILENLPISDENAVIMAEVNIMGPLVSRLNEGESFSRLLMAKTLGRLHMSESSKVVVATEESLRTLATLAESVKEEDLEVGIAALENLSTVAEARQFLQHGGALKPLLNIVKGVRHSAAAKKSSAAIFANILAAGEYSMGEAELDETVCTFLHLLGKNTPMSVQVPLLQCVHGLARSSSVATRQKLKDCDTFPCLLSLLLQSENTSASSALRRSCLDTLVCLAAQFGADAAQSVLALPNSLSPMIDLVKDERREPREVQAATDFLASLPVENDQISQLLLAADIVPALIKLLNYRSNEALSEAAAGALLRFALPNNASMQQRLADAGVIQTYVNLLRTGGIVGKERAALALSFFSSNSHDLSEPMQTGRMMLVCFGGGGRRRKGKGICLVHGSACSVETTYCLVEAGAVAPLVAVLREEAREAGATAAALTALKTLVEAENGMVREEGFAVIDNEQGLGLIINLMSNSAPQVQDLAARLCEQLFNLPKYRVRYAGQAQMHIVALAQNRDPQLRQVAGRLLRHMELLQSQSSYFGLNYSVSSPPLSRSQGPPSQNAL